MSDAAKPSRLDKLLDGLHKAATTKNGKLPGLRAADAEEVCGHFHAQVDRGTAARAMQAAEQGRPVACARLCDHCCNSAPAIFAGEAVTIARWLERPENAELRDGFLERYPAWFAKVEDLLGAWSLAATAGDAAGAEAALTEVWRRSVMCAFNVGGACTIYEVRPNVCRNAHALDSNQHCKPGSITSPSVLPFPPLDTFLVQIRPVVFAMHAALHKDGTGSQPLCVAVHDELRTPSGKPPAATKRRSGTARR